VRSQHRGIQAAVSFATVTALVLLSALAGCTANQGAATTNPPLERQGNPQVLSNEESSFDGKLLQLVVEGLASGASQEAGSDAYGNILSLLGWGTDSDSKRYDAMAKTLTAVENGITEIKAALSQLQAHLNITEEEIIANTNDPTAAMTEITTYDDELQGLSVAAVPGKGSRPNILAFADKVESDYRIENDVNLIGSAIIPPSSAKSPVLDNYASLLIDRMNSQGVDLPSAYFALETYFSQLMYYQLQGVTLVVEAKTAEAKSGATPVGTDAATYYAHFRTHQLAPEVQNFMDNTWRLIVARVSLVHTGEFLPSEANGVAARAEFLRTQTLGLDHFGLRANAVVTSNHSGELTTATATSSDGTVYPAKTTATATVSGPVYDSWKGNTVLASTDYQILTFDFGAVPAGTYTVTGTAGFATKAVQVQQYTPDYSLAADGKILYGYAVGDTRVGAVEAFADGAGTGAGRTWVHGGDSHVSFSGNLKSDTISVSGNQTNGKFSGEYQVDYRFVYSGSSPAKVRIPSAAHAYGTLDTKIDMNLDDPGSAYAKAAATMGVWDSKSNKIVSAASSWSTDVDNNKATTADWRAPKNFAFTALPGHSYTVYFTVTVNGSGDDGTAAAKLTIDSMKGMYLQF
jgi:hypothetical protein